MYPVWVFLSTLLTFVVIMLKPSDFRVAQCSNYIFWCHVDELTAPGICANDLLVIVITMHSNQGSNATNVFDATAKLTTSGMSVHETELPILCY